MTDVYVGPIQTDGLLFAGEMYRVKACIDDYWMVEGDDLAVSREQSMFRFVTENNDDVVNRFMLDSASFSLYIPFYLRCIRERDFALARALWDKIISTAEEGTSDTFVRFPIFLPTGELSISNKYVWDGVKVYNMDVSRMKVPSSGDCRRFSLAMLMAYNTCVDIKNGWLTGVQVDTLNDYTEYAERILSAVPDDSVDDTEKDTILRALKATCEMLEV